MIIQVVNSDNEELGLFEVRDNTPFSQDEAETIIGEAFNDAANGIKYHDEDNADLISKADAIVQSRTFGQISRIFVSVFEIDTE